MAISLIVARLRRFNLFSTGQHQLAEGEMLESSGYPLPRKWGEDSHLK